MKRLFLSDLHIADGSSKDDFEFDVELTNLLNDFADESKVELIVVGDGFEILESQVVKELGLLPFEQLVDRIDETVIEDIFGEHPIVFETLRRFAKRHRVVYIVGNHDYYLLKNKKLNEKLKELMNIEIVPYYYIPEIGILAMHGNQFDVINKFGYDRKSGTLVPPLGDYIARYMMFFFDERVKSMVPENVLRDYDNVRPALDVFHWFKWAVDTYEVSFDVLELWISTFLKMMRTADARFWMKKNFPVMSCMSKLFLNKVGGMKLGSILVRLAMKVRSLRNTDYLYKTARQLLLGRRKLRREDLLGYEDQMVEIGKLNGVIFGHIHHNTFRIIPCNGSNKFYVNCGSWRPVVEKVNGKRKYGFHKKAELFYAVIIDHGRSDLEIITNTTNKLIKHRLM